MTEQTSIEERRAALKARLEDLHHARGRARLDAAPFDDDEIVAAERELGALEDEGSELARRTREAEQQAAVERQQRIQENIARVQGERLKALATAEAACREMCSQIASVLDLGQQLHELYAALGETGPPALAGQAAVRALSEKLSAALKTLSRDPERFGSMQLVRSWRRPDQSWCDDRLTPGRRRAPQEEQEEQTA